MGAWKGSRGGIGFSGIIRSKKHIPRALRVLRVALPDVTAPPAAGGAPSELQN